MPGFISHLLFGEQIIPFIPNKGTQALLASHLKAYSLGLEGPDIFFYHLPAYMNNEGNIGNIMHSNNVLLFFDSLIDARNSFDNDSEREIADCYILGFIGHYTLDVFCHPYIYFKSNHFDNLNKGKKYDFGKHVSLETDIDHLLLKHYKNLLPSQFDYANSIKINTYEADVISELLLSAISTTYPTHKISKKSILNSISSIIKLNRAMHDPKGIKKAHVHHIEHALFHCDFISSMIPSDSLIKYTDPCNENNSTWFNPWLPSSTSNSSFYDLLSQASSKYLERISLYTLYTDSDLDDDIIEDTKTYIKFRNDLIKNLSDYSYLTGLPL